MFIKKNKERWLQNQHNPSQDPDEMAASFTQLVDDLAYAKTFYPSGKVTAYINSQASKIYLDIYKNGVILFSLVGFVIFFAIGFFTSQQDDDVARGFFGDSYVEKTVENIESGNPFGIYESGSPLLSWLGIMINNIKVALLMFVSGLFCGIPTLYKHAETSAMVGIFDQFFAARGFGIDFWLVVFVHGTLEITALIISTAAGLVLGKSFLFPGTIKRMEAFKQGAKDGVKIMIGLMPVFALAAFFEGFITRLYNDVSVLTTIIFALSVIFVVWYFILYPIKLHKKLSVQLNEEEV